MKKLFLLTMVGLSAVSAFAQSQNSVVFTKQANMAARHEDPMAKPMPHNNGNKTTAGAGEWFDFVNLMYQSGTSKGYYLAISQDSNIAITYSNGNFNVSTHGFGASIDPTDSVFKGGDINGQTGAGSISNLQALPSFAVYTGNAYTVDSIQFPFKYYRHDNTTTDSLIINVFRVSRTGVVGATGQTQGAGAYQFTSSKQSFASVIVNPLTAKVDSVGTAPSANRQEIVVPLTTAFANDTDANGFSNFTGNGMKLPNGALSCNGGDVVVVYAVVRSSKTWALNSNGTTANFGRSINYDIAGVSGPAVQSGGSLMSGLVATNQTTYNGINPTDPKGFRPGGHNMPIPNVAYSQDIYTQEVSMKVTCPTCVPVGIRNVNTNVFAASAYPNPAVNELTIKFSQKTATAVNVSITNTVGQVLSTQNLGTVTGTGVATFSTANLANGLYFYTIESNGQRTTNRFVVAH